MLTKDDKRWVKGTIRDAINGSEEKLLQSDSSLEKKLLESDSRTMSKLLAVHEDVMSTLRLISERVENLLTIKEEVESHDAAIKGLQQDMSMVKTVTAQHSQDIAKLKPST